MVYAGGDIEERTWVAERKLEEEEERRVSMVREGEGNK
jgi:hypothetical protein